MEAILENILSINDIVVVKNEKMEKKTIFVRSRPSGGTKILIDLQINIASLDRQYHFGPI